MKLFSTRHVIFVLLCHVYTLRHTLSCSVCEIGSFSTGVAQTTSAACTQCAAGTYNPVAGATQSSVYVACSAGSYAAVPGTGTCAVCPGNSTGPAGSTNGSQCMCNPGFKGVNGSTCSKCNLVENCLKGTPTACPPFSSPVGDTPGMLVCGCLPGYYELPPQLQNLTSLCAICPAGAYCRGGSAGAPTCPSGKTSDAGAPSVDSCMCQDGYVGIGNTGCVPCTPGQYCTRGTSNTCPIGSTSASLSSSQLNCTCDAGWFGAGGGDWLGPCWACSR